MKKVLIFLPMILTACVATTQDIETDIMADEVLLTTINEYKNKKEYTDIVNESEYINSLTKTLKKAEYEKLDGMNIQKFDDGCVECYKEMCLNCYTNNEICSFSKDNDKDLIKKISSLTVSFKQQHETYCAKYDNKWATKEERQDVKNSCETILKKTFCDQLFNNPNIIINISNAKSKMEKYESALWEKRTGCKASKYTDIPLLYRVVQQTKDGTLIAISRQFKELAYYGTLPSVAFIVKNEIDSTSVDDEMVFRGSFNEIGTYKYTNTSGSTSTVKKYKRCE